MRRHPVRRHSVSRFKNSTLVRMGIWDAFFNRNEQSRERKYINQLFRVAWADGSLDKVELQYIYKVGHKLGMSQDELKDVRDNFDADSASYKPPRKREEKFFMLFYLINLIVVDNEIHPEEMWITENIVMKIGYSPDTVEMILNTININQEHGISAEETYESLKERLG